MATKHWVPQDWETCMLAVWGHQASQEGNIPRRTPWKEVDLQPRNKHRTQRRTRWCHHSNLHPEAGCPARPWCTHGLGGGDVLWLGNDAVALIPLYKSGEVAVTQCGWVVVAHPKGPLEVADSLAGPGSRFPVQPLRFNHEASCLLEWLEMASDRSTLMQACLQKDHRKQNVQP